MSVFSQSRLSVFNLSQTIVLRHHGVHYPNSMPVFLSRGCQVSFICTFYCSEPFPVLFQAMLSYAE